MPLGQLPVVETEHGQLIQATAIANYIAKKYGKLNYDHTATRLLDD